ncbi:hypothetical protein [Candidatus Solirubrobacter pratensis]|uniref:hypothetical protein n=1 Tax=Candidatus Solirubrobacter pratensis TaxID=1298857 RepID=UPI000485AC11|nr:hypothetical protein [Candidatus Solirubrobacter pratensis]
MKRIPFSGRAAIICALIFAIGVPTTAMGFGEGRNLLLGKRNPSSSGSRTLTSETEIIASNSTYGTRQSNKGSGGGAIYGCRAAATAGAPACVRASNLNGGQAFQFTTTGSTAGSITVAKTTGAPFTTNATGVATGLNADKVDGKDATDFAAASDVQALSAGLLFATVNANGSLGDNKRGAISSTKDATTPVYTVEFNRDVSKCSYTASVVGAAAATSPGVQSTQNQPTKVTVNLGGTLDNSFHLQVIC